MEIERKRAFIIQVVYYALLVALFLAVVKYALPLLTPFVFAFVIALILRRPTKWISKGLHLPYKPVALLLVLVFYSTIGMLIVMGSIRAFWGLYGVVQHIPDLYYSQIYPTLTQLFNLLEGFVADLDPQLLGIIQQFTDQFLRWLGTAISGLSAWAVGFVSGLAASIPGLFIKLVLMVIGTFFIAADFDQLKGFCMRQLSPKAAELAHQIKHYLMGTLLVCIASYLIIMSLTFVELSIGLSVIGVDYAILIAAAIAVFDILPVLGTGGIMIPWAIISMVLGDVTLGLELFLVYVVITIVRNIVEPKFVGHQLGLHPVVTLSSMFAGVQLGGVVAMFGFPIFLSLLRYLNEQGSIRLFKMEGKEEA